MGTRDAFVSETGYQEIMATGGETVSEPNLNEICYMCDKPYMEHRAKDKACPIRKVKGRIEYSVITKFAREISWGTPLTEVPRERIIK